LKDTLVSDLSAAAAFEMLNSLDITGTRISDLRALENTKKLAELNVGGVKWTPFVRQPEPRLKV
jgi:hypothetical protein